ncbi:urease accessory protein UreD [Brucella grignonensis]|uniref:Urease accessory protein UreD n=1 Tax=Brucella grignonensis TaxID=94627 RepID=A0A256F6E0_9HYPH|nr:urease accessory protein UreD [Brucella grignonensis]NKB84357.1 urease accessory protein UreD [Brucella grignonensis]OYR10353.1 ureD urease accessory family protein [Brucella grignonensis]
MTIANDHLKALSTQRANGLGQLLLQFKDGRTRIAKLYQEGAAKIRMPRTVTDPLEAILINTSGGLTGGDRLKWQVELSENASAAITTQACERIYRSGGGEARIDTNIKLAEGTRLAWLPQETIVFNQSALTRRLNIEMEKGAEVLVVEATVFGRLAMGETVERALFHDRWRVRQEGRLVHAEELRLGPEVAEQLHARAVANQALAIATVLMVSEQAERHLDAVRTIVGEDGGCSLVDAHGVSKLIIRLIASDSYKLRKRLVPLLALLNGKAGLPKVWSI